MLLLATAKNATINYIISIHDLAMGDCIKFYIHFFIKTSPLFLLKKWIHFYERYPYPVVARCLAVLLHRNAHAKVVDLITERLKKATSVYPNRSFGEKEDENIGKLLGRAEKRKEELERAGIHAEVLHEEPFTTAKDFHVYVMQLKKGVINRKVLIEEISE